MSDSTVQQDKRGAKVPSDSAWWRGIEKIQAQEPAGFRQRLDSTEQQLTAHLANLRKYAEGCGSHAWVAVDAHSGAPGEYSGKPTNAPCHVRGCPRCRAGNVASKLADHAGRIREAFGSGHDVVLLRLDGLAGQGPAAFVAAIKRFVARRTVQEVLPPTVFGLYPSRTGRYGATFILTGAKASEHIGALWAEATGGGWHVDPVSEEPFDAVVRVRVETEAAFFERVDDGTLPATIARKWLAEEIGMKRYRSAGGFTNLAAAEMEEPGVDEAAAGDVLEDPVCAGLADQPAVVDVISKIRELVGEYTGAVVGDGRFEAQLRHLADAGGDLSVRDAARVRREVDEALHLLPASHWTCPRHERCRLVPTGTGIRAADVEDAVALGRAVQDADGVYRWSDESWPRWQRRSQRLPEGATPKGRRA